MNEDKAFIESIITDKWYGLQKAAERGENLAYLRGSFTGFCKMASKKLPADFKAEADTLAQNIKVYASTARETPLQLADVVIDEVRGYYWRESKWTTR